jgi:hypothetical protein
MRNLRLHLRISWQVTSLFPFKRGMESKMRRMIGLACALFFSTLPAGAIETQSQCGPHEEVVKVLNAKYQESQRAVGLINEKAMMEVFISAQGTWTMVVTNEAGMTCILAAGEAWDEKPTQALGLGS